MTKEERKLENAIKHLKKIYSEACKWEHIDKPLAYAIYQTWKYYDCYETPRKRNKDVNV